MRHFWLGNSIYERESRNGIAVYYNNCYSAIEAVICFVFNRNRFRQPKMLLKWVELNI